MDSSSEWRPAGRNIKLIFWHWAGICNVPGLCHQEQRDTPIPPSRGGQFFSRLARKHPRSKWRLAGHALSKTHRSPCCKRLRADSGPPDIRLRLQVRVGPNHRRRGRSAPRKLVEYVHSVNNVVFLPRRRTRVHSPTMTASLNRTWSWSLSVGFLGAVRCLGGGVSGLAHTLPLNRNARACLPRPRRRQEARRERPVDPSRFRNHLA